MATDNRLAEIREKVYRDVDLVFENALFYKPIDGSAPDEIIKLAPLIVQEVDASQPIPELLTLSGSVVYYRETPVRNGDHALKAIVFSWQHGTDPRGGCRAIRITLGDDGFPAIFETYTGRATDFDILFVSKSLEQASAAAHSSALPGRRFAVEATAEIAPRAIVARVLDDGPMPMGPFVYLSKSDSTFTTLLCRCMASQVRQFVGNNYYELKPAASHSPGEGPKFPFDSSSPRDILRMPQGP